MLSVKSSLPKNYFSRLVLFFVYIVTVFLVYSLTAIPENSVFFATNFAILTASFFGMVKNKSQSYSLSKMVYIFIFFFFGVVPLNDISNKNVYWGAGQSVDEFYQIITNMLIMAGILAFWIGTSLKVMFFTSISKLFSPKICLKKFWMFILFICVAYIIIYVNNFDVYKLLFRGVVSEVLGESVVELSQLESLVINNFIRPLPFIILAIYVYSIRLNKFVPSTLESKYRLSMSSVFLFLLFFSSVFLVAPTSVPRFQAAALYIPLILIFTSLWNKPYRMQVSILGALLVIMPFLDKFRYFDPEKFSWSIDLSFMNQGHFDAYQNFSRVIEINLISYGDQLVGALFFFIPRSLWEGKPIGSGATLAESAGYDFSNISMPFIAEGYINFGVLGVVIFMFVFGVILGNFDRLAWRMKRSGNQNIFVFYYYFLFGMVFFIMRGDLMSSFAYTIGLTVSFLFTVYVLKFLNYKFRYA